MAEVKCNNCDWTGDDYELSLIEFDADNHSETPTAVEPRSGGSYRVLPIPNNPGHCNGCPNCLTDSYLMNLDNEE